MTQQLRNVAIIAHVDHGKTTLVDKLLQQSGTLDQRKGVVQRIMDSNPLEQERGITILAKNTAVDAVDGPMPQTRFVTQKSFEHGLNPIVVVNKIDRPGARPHWVIDQVFDLFDRLGANDKQLDFPVVYASALQGTATLDLDKPGTDLTPLFQTIIDKVSPPACEPDGPLQMQISALDYSTYVGTIGIGRIQRGRMLPNTQVVVLDAAGKQRSGRILQVLKSLGVERYEVPSAEAGDIVAVTGLDSLFISDTICAKDTPEMLKPLTVDEPTVKMTIQVNNSPFSGKEGNFVTSRQIRDRLNRELIHNVALRVEDTADPDKFDVSGRGELHLSILLETMRREGYEMAVGRPQVILREVDGEMQEPYEWLVLDLEDTYQGAVMEQMGLRRGDLKEMIPDGKGRIRLEYVIPARGLIGFHSEFLIMTSGTGIMTHVFDHYGKAKMGDLGQRKQGALISNQAGKATPFAIFNIQPRGRLFIDPQMPVYEGMIVGIHSRDNDLVVNVTREKQLTNMRASGTDENVILTPPIKFGLEDALEWINDDELVEITPKSIRIRKKWLKEQDRKRESRN